MAYTKTTWVDGQTEANASHMNNIEDGIYDATEAASTASTAGGTSYDNSNSGMSSSNVQDAIDEIKSDLTEIKGPVKVNTNLYVERIDRVVHLYSNGGWSSLLGTIPSGYRPTVTEFFVCQVRGTSTVATSVGYISITTAGVIENTVSASTDGLINATYLTNDDMPS